MEVVRTHILERTSSAELTSCLRRARPTSLELAFGAFEDPPVGTFMAHVAIP